MTAKFKEESVFETQKPLTAVPVHCTQDQTLKHQKDNYVQKDANSSGLHTDRPHPPCVCLALPIGNRAPNRGLYSCAKLRSIRCPDLRRDLNNSGLARNENAATGL